MQTLGYARSPSSKDLTALNEGRSTSGKINRGMYLAAVVKFSMRVSSGYAIHRQVKRTPSRWAGSAAFSLTRGVCQCRLDCSCFKPRSGRGNSQCTKWSQLYLYLVCSNTSDAFEQRQPFSLYEATTPPWWKLPGHLIPNYFLCLFTGFWWRSLPQYTRSRFVLD